MSLYRLKQSIPKPTRFFFSCIKSYKTHIKGYLSSGFLTWVDVGNPKGFCLFVCNVFFFHPTRVLESQYSIEYHRIIKLFKINYTCAETNYWRMMNRSMPILLHLFIFKIKIKNNLPYNMGCKLWKRTHDLQLAQIIHNWFNSCEGFGLWNCVVPATLQQVWN